MTKNISYLNSGCPIENMYQGAEQAMDKSNVIALQFAVSEGVQGLMDDLGALLNDPGNLSIAEPVLREAFREIASQLLSKT